MVVLFSNLLDNAIEACEKLDGDRVIRVSAVLKQSFFVFCSKYDPSSRNKK